MIFIFCKDNKFFLDMLRFSAILHYTLPTPLKKNDILTDGKTKIKLFSATFYLFFPAPLLLPLSPA